MKKAVVAVALWGFGARAEAFCTPWGPVINGWHLDCNDQGHDEITEDGLGMVARPLLGEVVDANLYQDDIDWPDGSPDDAAQHSTSCMFSETATYIDEQYGLVYAALSQPEPDPFTAAAAWGRALHAIQDFYAHSNWVELLEQDQWGGDGVLDDGDILFGEGGDWPASPALEPLWPGSDIVFAEKHATTVPQTYLADDSAIPEITFDGQTHRGLITGWNFGGKCYDSRVPRFAIDEWSLDIDREHNLVHGDRTPWPFNDETRPCFDDYPTSVCLNKDDEDRPYFSQAQHLATAQTTQEWCRLLDASLDGPLGGAAATRALAFFGADGQDLQPAGTSCAPAPGPLQVEVRMTYAEVDHPYAPSQDTSYAFTVLTEDLGHVARIGYSRPRFVTNPITSESVTMCVSPYDRIEVGLSGWENVLPAGGIESSAFDGDDVPLDGVSQLFFPWSSTASVSSGTVRLDVEVIVEPGNDDPDDDGLSGCGESYYGTDPNARDTDADGWPDGYEAYTLRSDPLRQDTDGDYLGDAENLMFGTDSLDPDTDDDRLVDGLEVWIGTDPRNPDTDEDGISDGEEVACGTDPLSPKDVAMCLDELDGDADGVRDAFDPSALASTADAALQVLDEEGAKAVKDWFSTGLPEVEKRVADGQLATAANHLDALALALRPRCVDGNVDDKLLPAAELMEACAELDRLAAALTGGK